MSERIVCTVCEHQCSLHNNQMGVCGVRMNCDGTVKNPRYGELVSMGVDPVEKKPLYHFMPGCETLSIAAAGCNFTCDFCQNHLISQKEHHSTLPTKSMTPETIVESCVSRDIPLLTFTYSEPTVWIDFVADCAACAHDHGIRTAMVTNGYFSEETCTRLLPLIDAYNIDYKGGENFYEDVCGGDEAPVIRNIARLIKSSDAVVEVTSLVIENYHSPEGVLVMAEKLENAGVSVWHLSRFFPSFRMKDTPPTSEQFMRRIVEMLSSECSIPHLYVGNIALPRFSNTRCSKCGKELILRSGYRTQMTGLKTGVCEHCGKSLYGAASM